MTEPLIFPIRAAQVTSAASAMAAAFADAPRFRFLVPDDAQVEITAKRAAGYYSEDGAPSSSELRQRAGRSLTD